MLEFELAYGKFSEANRSREKLPPLTKGEQDQLRSLADGIDAKKLQKSSMSFSSENYDATKNKQGVDISKRTEELQLLDKTAYEQIQIKNAIDQRSQAENTIEEPLNSNWNYYENDVVADLIKKLGYDGYIALETKHNTYAVYEPNKTIKILGKV